MRLGSILSGAAFRAALFFLPLFVIVLASTGAFVLNVARTTLFTEMRAQIEEELTLFKGIHDEEGTTALAEAVKPLFQASIAQQLLVGLFTPDGKVLAGNVVTVPGEFGWSRFRQIVAGEKEEHNYFGVTVDLGDSTIVIARTTHHIFATLRTLSQSLIIAGVLIMAIALVIGFAMSRGSATKLEDMARTLDEVSRGNTSVRLPVGNSRDQIDRISLQINAHLERLSELMHTTRNTIVSIAHDLRSPLNRAFFSVQQAIKTHKPSDSPDEPLNRALLELETMSSVFDTMLRISRIAASDSREGFSRFPARELLSEVRDIYDPVVEEAKQTLRFDVPDDVGPEIDGDHKMLIQLFVNLIENSIRFAPDGGEIVLGFRQENGGAIVWVADNGPGIPEDRRRDMLEPFHRLQEGGHDQGAGLGLALVKAIADRHGASLALSDNNPGLRVSVAFPAVLGAA